MELRLPISELEVLLGEKFSPDDARLQDTLREFYGFLPDTTSVSVEDGHDVVAWSATSEVMCIMNPWGVSAMSVSGTIPALPAIMYSE